ncbi:MAG: hypothetical protein J2P17_22545, partial [Mycobacterium sp.]|nr:hypothetical protein [Mycobacterium sp.]
MAGDTGHGGIGPALPDTSCRISDAHDADAAGTRPDADNDSNPQPNPDADADFNASDAQLDSIGQPTACLNGLAHAKRRPINDQRMFAQRPRS